MTFEKLTIIRVSLDLGNEGKLNQKNTFESRLKEFRSYQSTNMSQQMKTKERIWPLWTNAIYMRYFESEPDAIYFKYDFDEDFGKVKLTVQWG